MNTNRFVIFLGPRRPDTKIGVEICEVQHVLRGSVSVVCSLTLNGESDSLDTTK